MNNVAIPKYFNKFLHNNLAPPGHTFGLYFKGWQNNWEKSTEKPKSLQQVTKLSKDSQNLASSLNQRQKAVATKYPRTEYLFMPAKSNAPFMTGMGIEHPIENGFAFLNPYGLPYSPASSVKGVLRVAAEELALGLYGDSNGWDMLSVWWLFGYDANCNVLSNKSYNIDILDSEVRKRSDLYRLWVQNKNYDIDVFESIVKTTIHDKAQRKDFLMSPETFLLKSHDQIALQGAIRFWDVYPQSTKLTLGILTPHHSGYFSGVNQPHDSEQPIPNVFLTIPPNTDFNFYCQCSTASLPKKLQESWQSLMTAAFDHAFDWLGFGAKTSVGYGQMHHNESAKDDFNNSLKQLEEQQVKSLMSEQQLLINGLDEKLIKKQNSNSKEGIGGSLYADLKVLVNQSTNWSDNDKTDLRNVANNIISFIGANSNKNAKELLKSIK